MKSMDILLQREKVAVLLAATGGVKPVARLEEGWSTAVYLAVSSVL